MLMPPGVVALDVALPDELALDGFPLGARAADPDPDAVVEPVLLEFDPVQAVSNNKIPTPTAVPVSCDRLFVMIMRRL